MEFIILSILAFLSQFGCLGILKRLKDQRGEALPGEDIDTVDEDEDLPEDEDADLLASLDDVELEGFDEEENEEDEPEKDEEDVKPSDKKGDEDTPDKKELKRLQEVITGLRDDKVSLNKALHGKRATKKEADADPPLTREQIVAILKEHKGDEDTLVNVLEYIADQKTKGIESKVSDAVEVSAKKTGIEKVLFQQFPDLTKEDSGLRTRVDGLKTEYGIADNPYADMFAMGAIILDSLEGLQKTWKEQGRKEALGGKAEKKRKENIKGSDLVPKGKQPSKDDGDSLTTQQRETATKIFGFTTKDQMKTYAKLLSKNKKA